MKLHLASRAVHVVRGYRLVFAERLPLLFHALSGMVSQVVLLLGFID